MPIFEFDPDKSRNNAEKHGIDFVAAQKLWEDINLMTIESSTVTERRHLAIGLIQGKSWTAVYTWRNLNLRLISVRRSRLAEARLYEKNKRTRI
jgi:uncharacterized DUF497 family protein